MKNAPPHHPDEPFEIDDDNAALKWLVELGILDHLPKNPGLSQPWAAAETYGDHPTHWILAARFEGFPVTEGTPNPNGWLVLGQPKSRFSKEAFALWALGWRKQVFPDGIDHETAKPVDPSKN